MNRDTLPSLTRRRMMATLIFGGATLAMPAVGSNKYPNRPIKLIVPYPPGGGIDIIARTYAHHLSELLGQPVIAENKPGAATNIGISTVAKSEPDGYTLGIASTGLVNNPHFGPKPQYDTFRDLAPIGLLTTMPFMIAGGPSVAGMDMREVLERARKKPNSVSMGSSLRTQVEITINRAGVELLPVYYKGGAQAVVDAMGGQIDLVFGLLAVLMEHARSGQLKLLAIADSERSRLVPDVPTFSEVGIKGYPPPSWAAVIAPAGTPKPILDVLETATQTVTQNADFISTLNRVGMEVTYRSASQLTEMLKEQYAQSAALFKEVGG